MATPGNATSPYCRAVVCNNILSSSARLPQIQFAALPGQIDNSLTNSYRVTNPFSYDRRKLALASASLFYSGNRSVSSGQLFNLYFNRLAPTQACIWHSAVLYNEKIQNRLMSAICKLSKLPRKPTLSLTRYLRLH